MSKFDDALLFTSAGLTFAIGGACIGAPKVMEKMMWKDSSNKSLPPTTYAGIVCAGTGAGCLAVGLDKKAHKKDKKNMLKVTGLCWAACAAINANEVMAGKMRTSMAIPMLGGGAAMGATMLYRGFKE